MGSKKKIANIEILRRIIGDRPFLAIPESACSILGIVRANVLFMLLAKLQHYYLKNKLLEGNKFYFLQDEMKSKTGLSKQTQLKVIKELCEMGLVTTSFGKGSFRVKLYSFTEKNLSNIKKMLEDGDKKLLEDKKKHLANKNISAEEDVLDKINSVFNEANE